MANKLIELKDGTFVEIEVAGEEVQQISGGFAEKVDATLDKIKPVLFRTCQPVVEAVKELREDVNFEKVEVEVGLSFDVEGNIYVAKTKFGANVLVRMTLKSQE